MIQTQLLRLDPPYQIISAGGRVGIQVATLIVTEDKTTEDGGYAVDTHSHPVVNYGLKQGLDEALKYSSLPPVYLITCGGDMPARKVTFKAYEALEDAGVKCKLKYLPDKKLAHVFCITDPFSAVSQEVNNDMLKYWQENK